MKRKLTILTVFLLVLVFAVSVGAAAAPNDAQYESASNRFVFGETVDTAKDTAGDLFAMGSSVTAGGAVSGDLFAAGNLVKVLPGSVGGNIFAAGNDLDVSTGSARNIYAAGQSVAVSAARSNAAYLAGGRVSFAGDAAGLYVSAQSVAIAGNISGDAVIYAETIAIDDSTTIGGTLTVYSETMPTIPAGIDSASVKFVESAAKPEVSVWFLVRQKAYAVIAAALMALLLAFFFGRYFRARTEEFPRKVGWAILFGLIAMIAVPIVGVILLFTVVGTPIGLILLALYCVLLYVAPVYAGIVLGRFVLKGANRYLAAIAGAAVVRLAMMIPILGGFVYAAAAFYGFGALIMSLRPNAKEEEEPPVMTDLPVGQV